MRSIDLNWFYQLGRVLHPLSQIHDNQTVKEVWYQVWQAGNWLDALWSDEMVGLKVSREAVNDLRGIVRHFVPAKIDNLGDVEKTVTDRDGLFTYSVRNALQAFETNLGAELHVLQRISSAVRVSMKRNYS